MDARATMIIAKGKPITSDVIKCSYDKFSYKWNITFNNGKTFRYNSQNVKILDNPTILNPKNYEVSRNGKYFYNITAIFSFKDLETEYWHICFANGYEKDYITNELQITKSVLDSKYANQVFEYLKEVAEYTSVRTEDNIAILTKQYEKMDFLSEETVAAIYLNPNKSIIGTDLYSTVPIFPFGCNESQFNAVSNALKNRISVIEGPPGTGKTQTILNIIANLVLQGKTVQVVSNNNSAIENVIEKLNSPQYNIGFIAALLGSEQRKDNFINSQTGNYPDITAWKNNQYDNRKFYEYLRNQSIELQSIFQLKNELAKLQQEKQNVLIEQKHYIKMISLKELSQVQIIMKKLSSNKIMEFLQEYEGIKNGNQKAGFFYRIKSKFTYGININKILKIEPLVVSSYFHKLFYEIRLEEINTRIQKIESIIENKNADLIMSRFVEQSLLYFRSELAVRYNGKFRRKFLKEDLWKNPNEFLREYPVVLCTTYTARSSLGKGAYFDYVIMDEASQVDVATGMLALSCASNAVIVGDTKQLPNVITNMQKKQLQNIFAKYNIYEAYNYSEFSFLKSLCMLLGKRISQITLCEHYRCAPQIIGFCNKKFYSNALIVMTKENNNKPLQLVTTVKGNHVRDQMNQRQIDVIKCEILPQIQCESKEIGIIAPYRNQVNALKKNIENSDIDIATVHKFQGREKDVIILSTVDDRVTPFSDDPNLLNVAVSRAKNRLIVVASDNEQPIGSNIGDLIGYIRYNNCDIINSKISSVFDYLYNQHREERLAYLKKHNRISEYDSENLMYGLITDELNRRKNIYLSVVCHHPLNLIIKDMSPLNDEEKSFINTGLSHLDFLIYNNISKQPLLAIEVDGFHYHKDGTRQAIRDKLKNHILEVNNIPLLRFSTNGSGEAKKLSDKLNDILSD